MRRTFIISLCWVACLGMAAQHRLLGGDVSLLPSYEAQGTVYRDAGGQSVALLPFLRAQGWDALRVRLFVEPQYAPQNHREEGVCQDLGYVISLGRRIRQAGFQLLLDLHYSDYWADPGKQTMPHLWRDTRREDLPDSGHQYTRRTLLAMKRQGVVPQLIQVGNETTNGMLWPQGRIDWKQGDRGWDYLCQLYQAGCRACREVCPQARIVIHTEKPGSWDITRTYYQQLRRHCVDYDVIGLSYYPMWHGTIPNLGVTLDKLAERYPRKDVMIVEAAYYYMHNGQAGPEEDFSQCLPGTIEGQRLFTAQLVEELRKHKNVTGLFWWFPEENNYGTDRRGGLNRGLFNNATGCALPAMYQLSRFKK